MKHVSIGLSLLGALLLFSCAPKTEVSGSLALCPQPRSVVENGESFVVKKAFPAGVKTRLDATLGRELKPFQQAECYRLDVTVCPTKIEEEVEVRCTIAIDASVMRNLYDDPLDDEKPFVFAVPSPLEITVSYSMETKK